MIQNPARRLRLKKTTQSNNKTSHLTCLLRPLADKFLPGPVAQYQQGWRQ
jgi:hypothetical protein